MSSELTEEGLSDIKLADQAEDILLDILPVEQTEIMLQEVHDLLEYKTIIEIIQILPTQAAHLESLANKKQGETQIISVELKNNQDR